MAWDDKAVSSFLDLPDEAQGHVAKALQSQDQKQGTTRFSDLVAAYKDFNKRTLASKEMGPIQGSPGGIGGATPPVQPGVAGAPSYYGGSTPDPDQLRVQGSTTFGGGAAPDPEKPFVAQHPSTEEAIRTYSGPGGTLGRIGLNLNSGLENTAIKLKSAGEWAEDKLGFPGNPEENAKNKEYREKRLEAGELNEKSMTGGGLVQSAVPMALSEAFTGPLGAEAGIGARTLRAGNVGAKMALLSAHSADFDPVRFMAEGPIGWGLGAAGHLILNEAGGAIGSKLLDKLSTTAWGQKYLGLVPKVAEKYGGEATAHYADDLPPDAPLTVAQRSGNPKLVSNEGKLAQTNEKMMAHRLEENKYGTDAAAKAVTDLKKVADEAGWDNLDDILKASASGGPRKAKADFFLGLIHNMSDSGGKGTSDYWNMAKANGGLQLVFNKLVGDAKADTVMAIANPLGKVAPTELESVLARETAALKGNTGAPAGGLAYLEKIKNGIEGTHAPGGMRPTGPLPAGYGAPTPEAPVDPLHLQHGNPVVTHGDNPFAPPTQEPVDPLHLQHPSEVKPGHQVDPRALDPMANFDPKTGYAAPKAETPAAAPGQAPIQGAYIAPQQNFSWGGMRQLRSSIQARISAIMEGKLATTSDELAPLQRTVDAITKDMNDFAEAHPESGLKEANADLNLHHATKVAPYKNPLLGQALADSNPQAFIDLMVGSNATAQRDMLKLVGDKGTKAIQAGWLDSAVRAGGKTQRGGMGSTMSLKAVADTIQEAENSGSLDAIYPRGSQARSVTGGVLKLLRTLDSSDTVHFQAAGNTPGIPTNAGGVLHTAVTKVMDWINGERLYKAYTDPQMKMLMIRANSLDPKSKAFLDIASRQLPKLVAKYGTDYLPSSLSSPGGDTAPKQQIFAEEGGTQ